MMVTLGNDSSSADLSYVFEALGIGTGSGGNSGNSSNSGPGIWSDDDPCNNPDNWTTTLNPTTGKCYYICTAKNWGFEVSPEQCRSIIPKKPASTNTGDQKPQPKEVNWMTQNTIVSGLPNWLVVVGGAALAAVMLNN
jgi:hypothetical protein